MWHVKNFTLEKYFKKVLEAINYIPEINGKSIENNFAPPMS